MGEAINTAVTYRLHIPAMDRTITCPVLAKNEDSMLLAMEWAGSLVRHSGFSVRVFRNHTQLIEVPAK